MYHKLKNIADIFAQHLCSREWDKAIALQAPWVSTKSEREFKERFSDMPCHPVSWSVSADPRWSPDVLSAHLAEGSIWPPFEPVHEDMTKKLFRGCAVIKLFPSEEDGAKYDISQCGELWVFAAYFKEKFSIGWWDFISDVDGA